MTSPSLPLAPKPAFALAGLSAVFYVGALPGFDLWPLALVCWAPLLVAMQGQSVKRATLLAWASGGLMASLGFYWVYGMLRVFSGLPAIACLPITLLFGAFHGGRFALLGALYARASAGGWHPRAAVFLAFIASEQLYPVIFDWYYGNSVYQIPELTQIAELGNPILVGVALLASNVAIAELVLARRLGQRPSWRAIIALFSVPLVVAIYGTVRIGQVESDIAAADPVRVGMVQANMGLDAKRKNRKEGVKRHVALTRQLTAAAKKAGEPLDLVVWAETSIAGPMSEKRAYKYYSQHFSRRAGVPLIFGALLQRKVDDARGYVFFNTAILTDARGKVQGRYDKIRLLPFGEQLPFGDRFPELYKLSPNTGRFSSGSTLAPFSLGEHKINVHICYEDILPAFINGMMQDEPVDLMVNMTNDAWYGDTTEPWGHLAQSTFRAIEHRRFLVRSTNSGVSAIVDPLGRIVVSTKPFEQQAVVGEVAFLRPPKTPYETYGDIPWWLASAAAVYMAMIPRRRGAGESTTDES